MDLGAYVQIEDLDNLLLENKISVDRLRGLRLMKSEEPVNLSTPPDWVERAAIRDAVEGDWKLDPDYSCSTNSSRRFIKKHPTLASIHGWKRKIIKYHLRKTMKQFREQYGLWNKYVGRDDVLYIHARLGSWSWSYTKHWSYKDEPWYLGSCDDVYDPSYCDIYAKIKIDGH